MAVDGRAGAAGTTTVFTCGDMVFSGHTSVMVLCAMVWHQYYRWVVAPVNVVKTTVWIVTIVGLVNIIATRFHYTLDVLLGFYFTVTVWSLYHRLANDIVLGVRFTTVFVIDGLIVYPAIEWLEGDTRRESIYERIGRASGSRGSGLVAGSTAGDPASQAAAGACAAQVARGRSPRAARSPRGRPLPRRRARAALRRATLRRATLRRATLRADRTATTAPSTPSPRSRPWSSGSGSSVRRTGSDGVPEGPQTLQGRVLRGELPARARRRARRRGRRARLARARRRRDRRGPGGGERRRRAEARELRGPLFAEGVEADDGDAERRREALAHRGRRRRGGQRAEPRRGRRRDGRVRRNARCRRGGAQTRGRPRPRRPDDGPDVPSLRTAAAGSEAPAGASSAAGVDPPAAPAERVHSPGVRGRSAAGLARRTLDVAADVREAAGGLLDALEAAEADRRAGPAVDTDIPYQFTLGALFANTDPYADDVGLSAVQRRPHERGRSSSPAQFGPPGTPSSSPVSRGRARARSAGSADGAALGSPRSLGLPESPGTPGPRAAGRAPARGRAPRTPACRLRCGPSSSGPPRGGTRDPRRPTAARDLRWAGRRRRTGWRSLIRSRTGSPRSISLWPSPTCGSSGRTRRSRSRSSG